MRFANLIAVAFATCGYTQTVGFDIITKPTAFEDIPAGQTYTIEWGPGLYNHSTVTITLLGGATSNELASLQAIAQGVENVLGVYDWRVDSSLGDYNVYGFSINLDDDTSVYQYSYPFHISKNNVGSLTTMTLVTTATSQLAGSTIIVTFTSTRIIDASSTSGSTSGDGNVILEDESGSGPLSTAQKIGIGISVGMGAIITVFGIWLYRLRKKQPRVKANKIGELEGTHSSIWKHFLGGAWRAELHSTASAQKRHVAELDGSDAAVRRISNASSRECVELDATEAEKGSN